MRGKELLTAEQRDEFMQIPQDIGEQELGIYFTLSEYDIEVIKRHWRDHNRLGFACATSPAQVSGMANYGYPVRS